MWEMPETKSNMSWIIYELLCGYWEIILFALWNFFQDPAQQWINYLTYTTECNRVTTELTELWMLRPAHDKLLLNANFGFQTKQTCLQNLFLFCFQNVPDKDSWEVYQRNYRVQEWGICSVTKMKLGLSKIFIMCRTSKNEAFGIAI